MKQPRSNHGRRIAVVFGRIEMRSRSPPGFPARPARDHLWVDAAAFRLGDRTSASASGYRHKTRLDDQRARAGDVGV